MLLLATALVLLTRTGADLIQACRRHLSASNWLQLIDRIPEQFPNITREEIESAIQTKGVDLHIIVRNGKVFIKSLNDVTVAHNAVRVPSFLKGVCLGSSDLRLEFLVNTDDQSLSSRFFKEGSAPPVFSWSVTEPSHASNDIYFPYWSFTYSVVEPPDTIPSVKSWLSKSPVAFFRGSTSGSYGSDNRRYQLALFCNEHAELCDAKFTQTVQWWDEKELTRVNLMDKTVISHKEQCEKYRIIIVVDGNGPPASRLKDLLSMCNSVILLQETDMKEFYMFGLTPFVHYIPLSQGFEDLKQKINWINSNPEKAISVIKNARSYANRYFNDISVSCFSFLSMEAYQHQMSFVPATPSREHVSMISLHNSTWKDLCETTRRSRKLLHTEKRRNEIENRQAGRLFYLSGGAGINA